ncbi:MAG TPA: tyrosine--tRNA ligase, partial [Lachnospiraceae bacterium]|nr:tyrosine--tRNA ligase [Lachnospiraceae bacterium]
MLEPKEQMRIIMKGVQTLVNEEELMAKLEKSYQTKQPLIVK